MATRCLLVAAVALTVAGWSAAEDAPKTCDPRVGHFSEMCKKACNPGKCKLNDFRCLDPGCPERWLNAKGSKKAGCVECKPEYFGHTCSRHCHDESVACHGHGKCIPLNKDKSNLDRAGFCNCEVKDGYIGDDCNMCDFTNGFFVVPGTEPKYDADTGRWSAITCKKHTPTEADKHNSTIKGAAAGEGECEKPNLFWPILIATIATIGFVGAALLVYVLMAVKGGASAAGSAGKGATYNEL